MPVEQLSTPVREDPSTCGSHEQVYADGAQRGYVMPAEPFPLIARDWLRGVTMCTVTKKLIDLSAPDPALIDRRDIAHALGQLCRYGGHTPCHYSVAEHSLYVAAALPPALRLHGLLHDAHEAYLGDVISPVKRLHSQNGNPLHRDNLEGAFDLAIFIALGIQWEKLSPHDFTEVHAADLAVGMAECVAFGIPVTPGREQAAWDWQAAGYKQWPHGMTSSTASGNWLAALERELEAQR